MSKFKNKLMRRIMAVVLSGAMVLSNLPASSMSVHAAEIETETDMDIALNL